MRFTKRQSLMYFQSIMSYSILSVGFCLFLFFVLTVLYLVLSLNYLSSFNYLGSIVFCYPDGYFMFAIFHGKYLSTYLLVSFLPLLYPQYIRLYLSILSFSFHSLLLLSYPIIVLFSLFFDPSPISPSTFISSV